MYLGDNLLKEGIAPFVHTFEENRPDALILLQKVADPQSYGIAELSPEGVVTRLAEKPAQPRTPRAGGGVPVHQAVFASVKAITPSFGGLGSRRPRDMVDRGLRVEPHIVSGWWKDTGKLEDILEANRLILSTLESDVQGELVDTQLEGQVVVEKGARLERCTVRGPAVIGSGCVITDTFIGPYTPSTAWSSPRRAGAPIVAAAASPWRADRQPHRRLHIAHRRRPVAYHSWSATLPNRGIL
jgi:glucose-1-phosphate thymidylyltransferase